MTDVSCVIVGHREAHIIYPTIKSVLRSIAHAREFGLSVDLEVILDKPDSETEEIVRRTVGKSGRIHIVNYGDLAFSRNYASTKSKGKYIAFVDGDDLWCKTWVLDAYLMALETPDNSVFHPEFNIYFGAGDSHVLHHVDMRDSDFELEAIFRSNYWTALSFARKELYLQYPYKKNTVTDGFGYEDWTWNYETISNGIEHRVVRGTAHFIRRTQGMSSLLAYTNSQKAIPRILDLYTRDHEQAAKQKRAA